jgi:3-phenylpropionate/trans-cinnamate dioxygenase ferredoxin reductase component
MPNRAVIVGAGAGGDAAAMGLRKQGFEGEVVLLGEEEHRPYERPYLSKQFLRGEIPDEKAFLRPEGEYDSQGIDYRAGARVVRADRASRELSLDSGERIGFDHLVLATGSTPRRLAGVPDASNVFTLRSLNDARVLRQGIAASGRVLLVGAGFIGAEIAASARQMGKDVLMVEVAAVPLERVLGADIGRVYARIHRDHGVDLRTETAVDEWIVEGDRVAAVILSDGRREEVDVAVIAIGVTPNLELAEQLGLDIGPEGLMTDESLRAGPEIYAVGDIAAHLHQVYGRRLRVEHWQVAQRQGTAVAAAIAGDDTPYTQLPWFWSDQYDVNLQYLGHAYQFDQTVVRGDLDGEKFSVFYLKAGVIEAVLSVNDGRTGRFSRELISRRAQVEPSILSDPDSDLRALSKAANV